MKTFLKILSIPIIFILSIFFFIYVIFETLYKSIKFSK